MFEKLSEILANKPFELIITIMVVLVSLLTFPKFFDILIKEKRSKIGSKEKLFKLLDSNLSNNLIKDKEDILLLINSVGREFYRDFSLAPILEDYIAYSSSKEKSEVLKENYKLLKDIIQKENEEKPFSNIPDQERRLLRAIDDSVKYNDVESIQYHLQELNSVISTRHKTYEKSNRLNKWSIPVAIIGLILTIVFGIMSLKPAIDYNKIKEVNSELVSSSS